MVSNTAWYGYGVKCGEYTGLYGYSSMDSLIIVCYMDVTIPLAMKWSIYLQGQKLITQRIEIANIVG